MAMWEMSKMAPSVDILGNSRLTFGLRLVLGMTFLVFGASKLTDLTGFANTVISYHVLPMPFAQTYALVLPWAEVIIGMCFILGLGLRFVAPAAILIIASLIAGTSGSLYLLGIGLEDCGCLGGVDWPLGTSHLIAQVIMLIVATQIWLHKGEFFSLNSRLSPKG